MLASQKFVFKSAEVIFDVKKHKNTLPGKEEHLKEALEESRQDGTQGNQNTIIP